MFIKLGGNITLGKTARKPHYVEVGIPEDCRDLLFSGIFPDWTSRSGIFYRHHQGLHLPLGEILAHYSHGFQ